MSIWSDYGEAIANISMWVLKNRSTSTDYDKVPLLIPIYALLASQWYIIMYDLFLRTLLALIIFDLTLKYSK